MIRKANMLDHMQLNDQNIPAFLDKLIMQAIDQKASDIHFETYQDHCRIRFRIDGILYERAKFSPDKAKQINARLKIMSALDIAESRRPQDGRAQFQINERSIDIRTSTCPGLYGEKIVLRLLNAQNQERTINEIGFSEQQASLFLEAINKPQGLILVTGPTGSGKTVTLYAALQHLNTPDKNIATVEDPVEINLPGVHQVAINLKADVTFPNILRTFLRQDPDILMVGEIRDLETAQIAIKAAQTGHLVLSTLHTNSAIQAITRLKHMGIKPYQLTGALTLITAQRLIRTLCPLCKKPIALNEALKKNLSIKEEAVLYEPGHCEHCTNGYQGRIAIHEVLTCDETVKTLILDNANLTQFKAHLKTAHTPTIEIMGLSKWQQGLTSFSELQRVLDV